MDKQSIAQLSGGAARLLLALLLEPEDAARSALMATAGLGSVPAFYRAKAQLAAMGLQDSRSVRTAFSLSESDSRSVRIPFSPSENDEGGDSRPVRTPLAQREPAFSPTETAREVPAGDDFLDGITGSWLAQCSRADRLPADGDPMQRGSNWQARRRAQIEALQGAYRDLFAGQELHPAAAKDMLRLAHDSAEGVYEAMEKAAARGGIQFPTTYIQGILRKEAAAAPAPATVSRPQDGELVLRELTDEDRAVSARLKRRLIASGYVLSEEDR